MNILNGENDLLLLVQTAHEKLPTQLFVYLL